MSISSVCTCWWSIALLSSAIWSRISLELSPKNSWLPNVQSVLSGFLQTVELHLHRSGQHPLTIELDISGSMDEPDNVIPCQLLAFDLVCNHSWCSFDISGNQPLSVILAKPQFDSIWNCHTLKSLGIEVACDVDKEMELFKQANGLCSLSLAMLSGNSMPGTFWKEISSLTVESMQGKINNVFNHANSPKELVLGDTGDDLLPIPCVPPRSCSSVLILILELGPNWDYLLADVAFSSFTFPSLSCLAIMTYYPPYPYQKTWPKATLGAFLRQSSCNLTKFAVRNVSVSDTNLIHTLKLMPSLINLYVDDTPVSDGLTSPITSLFIRSLHGFLWTELNPSSLALVPKLYDLQVMFEGLEFDNSAFIDMVSSRWLPEGLNHSTGSTTGRARLSVTSFSTLA
ncbi:hypothetical protein BDP27DRAFT_1422798 [Rhodocollybia butyracea]|uniref:Uncharacterized protein n=1 Tax=Rhodocollybia butyracea TaxID=206335 RepID=A0A9P5U678_9AGAR|nr:hypothetical protein BDP27DRAFT_1422798 [Rhodocollybia butyracea]